ncbi:ferredoxin--nitrite reductase [Picosynechococcus sp. PCC 73109]|uniref:ferredoxin--nitrite reductase n=1 Tax=Picosynechococcus sp. PCC 73109 TaxID=374982 RepID=UPI0007457FA4|nr:ferredoxin--nitrite reductase [Picosynechococcus sp. PCC 73109]AMA09497.1 ferredoxin--nitrite reductase [Picosynechococcus sp. PCC 73109]
MTDAATIQKIKLTKIEQAKQAKPGLAIKDELATLAQAGWEAMDQDDLIIRLKFLGLFHRPVTPGKFMLRLRTPHGILNSAQVRALAEIVQRYGEDGSADITTRQNIQLRGIRLEDTPEILTKLKQVGLSTVQSGHDNVRNITGSPVAGIDPEEYFDTRELAAQLQNMITNYGEGSLEFSDLPRKFNICLEGAPDNSSHVEINDIGFVPAFKDGQFGFNVLVGGYFSAQRQAEGISINVWVPPNEAVLAVSRGILALYTRHSAEEGLRGNRAKARVLWLVEAWGVDAFRARLEAEIGQSLEPAAPEHALTMDKRDHIGVYAQKQAGYHYVGLHVPAGRLTAEDMFEVARLAETYGNGEIRATVEENFIIPYVKSENVEALLQEPLLEKFSVNPSTLVRSFVSCTGNRYCNFALVETKEQGLALARELDAELDIPQRVRMHWTGCPNSCGQAQVGDIGFIGSKAKVDGAIVEAVNVLTGGTVGNQASLGAPVAQKVPCGDTLKATVKHILIEQFGATPKSE